MAEAMLTQPMGLAAVRPGVPRSSPGPDLLPFVQALSSKLIEELHLDAEDFLVELGAEAPYLASGILEQKELENQILSVHSSPRALASVPVRAEIREIEMDALSFAAYPIRCDKVLMKDGISGIDASERARLFAGLRDRLTAGGILLLVNTVPDPDSPLFDAALQRLEAEYVSPDELGAELKRAGFAVHPSRFEHRHRIPLDRYCRLVVQRFLPVLQGFSDREMDNGVGEIRRKHPGRNLVEYTERFDLLAGARS